MSGILIECVANFSEGRDAAKVARIEAAVASAVGAGVLDRHFDADHNRSVITFAGAPGAVAEGALRAIAKAAALIDLRTHSGLHPRIGAADVVPLVPVAGATLENCAEMAVALGERVWAELGIPVYLYEAAARSADRMRLEDVRRGQFEGLSRDPSGRPPDIGGPALHPSAGATVIGARDFLVAYNIDLETADPAPARAIARAVRTSSGGLPAVKALGLYLASRGHAQVSMNLTDFRRTSPQCVFEAVGAEAARLGVALGAGELIGLVPRAALAAGREWFDRLSNRDANPVLEDRLAAAGMPLPSRP